MCLKLVYDKIFSSTSYGRSSKLTWLDWLELQGTKLDTLKLFSVFDITVSLDVEPELLHCCLVDTILIILGVILNQNNSTSF